MKGPINRKIRFDTSPGPVALLTFKRANSFLQMRERNTKTDDNGRISVGVEKKNASACSGGNLNCVAMSR